MTEYKIQILTLKRRLGKFIIIVATIVTVLFIGAILFFVYGIPHGITSELKQIQCNGIIISMMKTNPCFMTVEVSQRDETIKFDVNYCVPKDDFFKFAAIGDSIKKDAGQLSLTITKKDNGDKKTFDYPYTIQ